MDKNKFDKAKLNDQIIDWHIKFDQKVADHLPRLTETEMEMLSNAFKQLQSDGLNLEEDLPPLVAIIRVVNYRRELVQEHHSKEICCLNRHLGQVLKLLQKKVCQNSPMTTTEYMKWFRKLVPGLKSKEILTLQKY